MTTIIAVQNSDHVLFGSDSQVTAGHQKSALSQGKIFTNGKYTIGAAGRFRYLQMLQHMDLPEPDNGPLTRFVATILIPAIKAEADKQNAGFEESAAILTVYGEVYEVAGDGSILQYGSNVYTIGSGSVFANGSLSSVDGEPTAKDVQRALEAAARHDVYTSGPFFVRKI